MDSKNNSKQESIVNSNIMKNKIGIVMGVANERSLAWGVTKTLSDNGADIILTYQGEALKKRIVPLAEKANARDIFECDVSDEKSIKDTFDKIYKKYGKIDYIVHAIAYSDKEELKGKYIEISRKIEWIFINDFITCNDDSADLIRRFISFIDICYRNKIKVKFFFNNYSFNDLYTGDKLKELWERCSSRLNEMQTLEYLT